MPRSVSVANSGLSEYCGWNEASGILTVGVIAARNHPAAYCSVKLG